MSHGRGGAGAAGGGAEKGRQPKNVAGSPCIPVKCFDPGVCFRLPSGEEESRAPAVVALLSAVLEGSPTNRQTFMQLQGAHFSAELQR